MAGDSLEAGDGVGTERGGPSAQLALFLEEGVPDNLAREAGGAPAWEEDTARLGGFMQGQSPFKMLYSIFSLYRPGGSQFLVQKMCSPVEAGPR